MDSIIILWKLQAGSTAIFRVVIFLLQCYNMENNNTTIKRILLNGFNYTSKNNRNRS